jgi:hypothetical protein
MERGVRAVLGIGTWEFVILAALLVAAVAVVAVVLGIARKRQRERALGDD